jgi:hypothetical protein
MEKRELTSLQREHLMKVNKISEQIFLTLPENIGLKIE